MCQFESGVLLWVCEGIFPESARYFSAVSSWGCLLGVSNLASKGTNCPLITIHSCKIKKHILQNSFCAVHQMECILAIWAVEMLWELKSDQYYRTAVVFSLSLYLVVIYIDGRMLRERKPEFKLFLLFKYSVYIPFISLRKWKPGKTVQCL